MSDTTTGQSEKHFNALTPAETERLALLAEECGELVQAVGKVLRHGYDSRHPLGGPTNREAVEREIADVYTAIWMMFQAQDIRRGACGMHEDIKRENLHRYLHHAKVIR